MKKLESADEDGEFPSVPFTGAKTALANKVKF